MSRKGCSLGNAACEGFFGRLKTEMFFARDWLSTSIEEFVAAVDAYVGPASPRCVLSGQVGQQTAPKAQTQPLTGTEFKPRRRGPCAGGSQIAQLAY
jgi:transposase InsO family protein